jgi:tetratricopeptide (TPR) repeat protein
MAGLTKKELARWEKEVARLAKAGRIDDALSEARALGKQAADSAEIQYMLGSLYLRLGETESSVTAFRSAGRLAQRQWKVALLAARALSAAGLDGDALDVLRSLDPNVLPGALGLERAVLLRRLDRQDEAVSELSATVDVNPHYTPAWDELIGLLETLGRAEDAEAARRGRDAVTVKHSPAEVVRKINEAFPDDSGRYVVNFGCRDGKMKDPCYELYRDSYPGLAVDAADDLPELFTNLPQPEVRKLIGTLITPANVADLLRREGCPARPALIKIDIDSYDGPVLEAALTAIDPDVIHIEVNSEFPPPLRFTVQYDVRYRHSWKAGFSGCSVSYVTSICRPRGYELLELDFTNPHDRGNAILVKERYLGLWDVSPPVDERKLFLREPYHAGRGLTDIGIDTAAWRDEHDFQELLSEAWDACVAASLQRFGVVLPFMLTL